MAPPLLPFAWIVGILLALCVTHHRKPSKPQPQPQPQSPPPPDPSRSSTSAETRSPPPAPPERDAEQSRESPAGTARSWGGRRGLSLSASASARVRVRVPERIAARMRARRRERKERSAEEAIWMKTIILGERCRVPSDDEGENENGYGRRPRHYRPRTPRSVPVSRTNSFLDLEDAASSPAFGAGD